MEMLQSRASGESGQLHLELCGQGYALSTTMPTKQKVIWEAQQEAKKMGLGRIATQNGAALRKVSHRAQAVKASCFDKS